MTVYWYSMWAHRRDLSWKGFIQIPLNPQLDVVAMTILNSATTGGQTMNRNDYVFALSEREQISNLLKICQQVILLAEKLRRPSGES